VFLNTYCFLAAVSEIPVVPPRVKSILAIIKPPVRNTALPPSFLMEAGHRLYSKE
jgi:hypothetical protein